MHIDFLLIIIISFEDIYFWRHKITIAEDGT